MFRDGKTCGMKDGNPFGPFWDHFGVDFDGYVDHPGILWGTNHEHTAHEWNERCIFDHLCSRKLKILKLIFPNKTSSSNCEF